MLRRHCILEHAPAHAVGRCGVEAVLPKKAAGISLVAGVSLPLFSGGQFNASSIWVAVALIGLTTFLFSACGVKLGNRFGARYGTKAEVTGGVILILLGLKILLEHLGVW